MDDIIWGADEIAKVIRCPRRVAYYLLEGGRLPAKRVGRRWVARRSELVAAFSSLGVAA
jgi:excisionase family DNA binding protein